MRIPEVVDPRTGIKTIRVDDKDVTLPFADGVSEPFQIFRVLGKLSSITPDFTQHAIPFEDLDEPARSLKDFNRPVGEEQNARYAEWITRPRRIISLGGRYSAWSI